MMNRRIQLGASLFATAVLTCATIGYSEDNPVADDVLFLVLGKMSLYDQAASGDITLRDHHFVAEIMPKAGREILSGTLASVADPTQTFEFNPEGNALARARSTGNESERTASTSS